VQFSQLFFDNPYISQPAIILSSLLWEKYLPTVFVHIYKIKYLCLSTFFRYLLELGIEPVVAAGHSLGDIKALHTAGALTGML